MIDSEYIGDLPPPPPRSPRTYVGGRHDMIFFKYEIWRFWQTILLKNSSYPPTEKNMMIFGQKWGGGFIPFMPQYTYGGRRWRGLLVSLNLIKERLGPQPT